MVVGVDKDMDEDTGCGTQEVDPAENTQENGVMLDEGTSTENLSEHMLATPNDKEDEDYRKKQLRSGIAKKYKPIKDVVNKFFQHLMGIDKLDAKTLPLYPHGIDRTNSDWLKDPATSNPLLCFDWKKTHRQPPNQGQLRKVYKYIVANGVRLVPEAKESLVDITQDSLMDKLQSKWTYMATQWRNLQKAENEQVEYRQREEDLQDEAEEEENDS
ncbi:hypothetical protein H2248_010388 [Termitomyces sp. 'cryptogamus']|nr:hypothetical protein H2248_010388 [Termitomyces sp. 'cryptogamus']